MSDQHWRRLIAVALCLGVTGVVSAQPTPPAWAAAVNADAYLLTAADTPGWSPVTDGVGTVHEFTVGDEGAMTQTNFALVRTQKLTAGGKTVALKAQVFENAAAASDFCRGVEVWGLDQTGNPARDTTWDSARDDVSSPLLAGNGGAAFMGPAGVALRCRRACAMLQDTGTEPAGRDALKTIALAWLTKVSTLPDGGGGATVVRTVSATPVAPTVDPPAGADAIVVLQPTDGATIGPNIDIIGRAGPNQLIVSYILAFRADTGEQVRNVPGFRGKSKDTGDFAFRVATPRISFGDQKVQVSYELRLYVARPDGTKGPETVVKLLAPPP